MTAPSIEPLGDQALLLRWSDSADIAVNHRVHAVAARLHAACPPWLIDCVPAYASLAVFFDAASIPGPDAMTVVSDYLSAVMEAPELPADGAPSRLIEIPVCYGGEYGPDLLDVANTCGLSAVQLVEKHSAPEYLVAMLGFSPGFPYLLGLDPKLAVPRLSTPRVRVPAGSVGIGGAQTGVYPDAGPGGWRLIGCTPQSMFDARRHPPARALAGDRVRFVPIDAAQFRTLVESEA